MQNLRQKMRRVFADTIFNRLFGLAFAAVFVSHAATFVLLFVFLRDASHPPPPELRPPGAESGYSSNHPPQYGARPPSPHRRSGIDGPLSGLLISMSLQLLLLAIGAWISSRTLARPIQNLAATASTLGDQQVVPVPETGRWKSGRLSFLIRCNIGYISKWKSGHVFWRRYRMTCARR
jgi:hypothetical protein